MKSKTAKVQLNVLQNIVRPSSELDQCFLSTLEFLFRNYDKPWRIHSLFCRGTRVRKNDGAEDKREGG